MGGKAKQSQRTKNNARPSSSGRSAGLLNNVFQPDAVFGTVTTGKALPTLFPTMSPVIPDNTMTNEFSLAFKKLNKKDPTTKTKALQELEELFKSSETEDVVATLPHWALVYPALSVDCERKVREGTQVCHELLMRACGRRAAPQLRRLLPAWLLAAHDDHAPVRARAAAALRSTFPEHKLADAIDFCKSDIMNLIFDNITGNTGALLNKNGAEGEERQAQECRVLAASLRALDSVLGCAPPRLPDLLHHAAFWALANHPSPLVRSSWYSAAGALVCAGGGAGGAAEGVRPRLAGALVSAAERRGDVAAARWDAVLRLVSQPDWQQWLKNKDLLVKRLIDTLENGGWGEARLGGALVGALVRALPADQHLYSALFDALFKGLEVKSIINSKSEREVWIGNIAQCARLVALHEGARPCVVQLLAAAHRTWLHKIFTAPDQPTRLHLAACSADKMASFVKCWMEQSETTGEEIYEKLIRNFWQNFAMTLVAQVESMPMNEDDINNLIEVHTVIFQSLKGGGERKKSLRFEDEAQESTGHSEKVLRRYEHEWREVVCQCWGGYLQCAEGRQLARGVLAPALRQARALDGAPLWAGLARRAADGSPLALALRLVRWLASDTMRCRAVADLLFIIAAHLADDQLDRLYASFQQLPPSVVEWCIEWSLSDTMRARGAATQWLRGAVVTRTLATLCARASPAADQLLLRCLDAQHGDLPVSEEAARCILEAFAAALRSGVVQRSALQRAAAAARALLQPHLAALHHLTHPLLYEMFQINLKHMPKSDGEQEEQEAEGVEGAVWGEVRAAWSGRLPARLLPSALQLVQQKLYDTEEGVEVSAIEHLVSVCSALLSQELRAHSHSLLAPAPAAATLRTFALQHECVCGRLSCPIEDEYTAPLLQLSEDAHLQGEDVRVCARAFMFRAGLLRALHCAEPRYVRDELPDVLHDAAVIRSLCDGYSFAPFSLALNECKKYLDSAIRDIVQAMDDDCRKHIATALAQKSFEIGYYWPFAQKLYEDSLQGTPNTRDIVDDTHDTQHDVDDTESAPSEETTRAPNIQEVINSNGFFHSLQVEDSLRARYLCAVRAWCAQQWVGGAGAGGGALERRAVLVRKLAAVLPACDLTPLIDDYYQHCENMFTDVEYASASWRTCVCHSAVVDALEAAVRRRGWLLDRHTWDFVNIVLCSVLASLARPPIVLDIKTSMVCRASVRLLHSVSQFVSRVGAQCERRAPPAHVADLPAEWREIFAPTAYTHLAAITTAILERADTGRAVSACEAVVVEALLAALPAARWPAGCEHAGAALALRALWGAAPARHYLAYRTLQLLAKPLVLDDVEKIRAANESEREEEGMSLSLAHYFSALRLLLPRLRPLLDDDCAVEEAGEAALAAALGFALTALAALRQAELARADLLHHYIHAFQESELIPAIVELTSRVAMERLWGAAGAPAAGGALSAEQRALFTADPRFSVRECSVWGALSAASCRVVAGAARGAGGALRSHWSSLSARRAAALRRLVLHAVAPLLIDEQLRHLRDHMHSIEDAEVVVEGGAGGGGGRTVRCRAAVEERTLELEVRLSEAHPLEAPRALAPPCAAAPAHRLHAVRMYLAYQNGWVSEALRMWAEGVRARVAAAPQCYICYSRLLGGALPALLCHTCSNRFHSLCLRKWFKTSKKSNCPLCRAAF